MKKLLATVLSVVMLLSLFPAISFADTADIALNPEKTYIVLGPDGFTTFGSTNEPQSGKQESLEGIINNILLR